MELLIGAGSNRTKKLARPDRQDWSGLVTLDIEPIHKPDVLHDLETLPLPFPDNHFDEVHAYDVLEHTGRLGDWKFFFAQWSEFWRILKPDGTFHGISPHPSSPWAFGDPGHTRIISPESFVFLGQPSYAQVGTSPMTDYRAWYRADFDLFHSSVDDLKQFSFGLMAIKPSRITGLQ